MSDQNFTYLGSELELFADTPNWKSYLQFEIGKVVQRQEFAVEVGSGIGSNAEYLAIFGNRYVGVDPDANLVEYSKFLHPNFEFKVGFASHLKEFDSLPDLIFYLDVLEHIESDELELEFASKLLAPNGKIIVVIPAFQCLFSDFDRSVGHFRRYSKGSFKSKVPNTLTIVEMKYLDSLGALLSLTAKIFDLRNGVTAKTVRFWHSLIPFSRTLDRILRNRFGKSILVVLERS